MSGRRGKLRVAGVAGLMLAGVLALRAQDVQASPDAVKFETLFSFDGANGANPTQSFVQGLDGNLYGAALAGGAVNGCGTSCGVLFKIRLVGAETTLYDFCSQPNCTDGSSPNQLALGTDGSLYGTTLDHGAYGTGTIFKAMPGGTLNTLYSFCDHQLHCESEGYPSAIVRGADGNFYGVTPGGGPHSDPACLGSPDATCGTAYRITPQGAFSIIHTFCHYVNCPDGAVPSAPLISGADGNLYGTTSSGGAVGYGTVFQLTPGGKLTTLHSFDGTNGVGCCAPLVQANNGSFYGASHVGYLNEGPGTFFELTPAGVFTTLYRFCSLPNCADGANPLGFVQGTDGNFYGVTYAGGSSSNCGAVFQMTAHGVATILHTFAGSDGCGAEGLIQATTGTFYGGAESGGANGKGALFVLSVGLSPFVETLPTSGKVAAQIKILGNDLAGAISVSFNGVAAAFTVESATLISATVPAGATTGFVEVATSSGTLKSNTRFRVR